MNVDPNAGRRRRGRRRRIASAIFVSLATLSSALAATPSLDAARELHTTGQCREAVPLYFEIADATRDGDPATAASALNNACLCLLEIGELEQAEAACNEALDFRRAMDDPARLARALNNTGRVVMRGGRYEEAARLFREALEINRTHGILLSEVRNLGNLGVLAIFAGRYGEALEMYRQIKSIATANADAHWSDAQRRLALLNEGVVLERLGAFDEALERYQILRQEGEEMPPRDRASLLANLGTLYRNLGDPVRAAESVREAAALAASVENIVGVANAEINLGIILHQNLEQPDAAETAYRKALTLSQEIGDSDLIIESALNLGNLLLASHRFDEALDLFTLAESAAGQSGSADALARSLTGLGRLRAAMGDLTQARSHLENAMATLEGVRAGIGTASLRARFLQDRRSVFESLVDVLVQMAAHEPKGRFERRALEIVGRAKHRDLIDAIGGGGDWEPPTVEDLQAVAKDALIIEYYFGENDLYRWTIDRQAVEFRQIASRGELDSSLREVHRALASGGSPRRTSMDRLSELLLGGISLEDRRHTFIAPDGLLHYLPFEALDVPSAPGTLLLDVTTVAYVPSGSLLTRQRPSSPRARRLLALGAPSVSDESDATSLRGLLSNRFALQPIQAEELDSIGNALGGRYSIRRGGEATESSFRAAAAEGANVIHLATHTVIDEQMAARAAVLLTPSAGEDGLLYPEEIASMPIHADLTLLAACSTALGSEDDGRGLTSLTGSFLAAGSGAVIATLWDVDDGAAAVFMQQLYYQLGQGLTPAEALRETKQRMRQHETWQEPSLWAAYVLVGDAPALVSESIVRRLLPITILAIVVVVTAGWMLRRRRRTP